MTCGIYKIENTVNGKVYIGSSNNIDKRFKDHLNSLNKNKHHSRKLQNAYNKYGEDVFKHETLIICSNEDKYVYEQIAIDYFKAAKEGYNINKKAEKGYSKPIEEISDGFFKSKVKVTNNNCHEFIGAPAGNGVGKVKRGGKFVSLHRLAYEYYIKEIPKNSMVYRTCSNKLCCNPEHLKIGTRSEITKNLYTNGYENPKGNSKLTEKQIKEILHLDMPQSKISEKYGVSQPTISNLLSGKTYKEFN